MTSDLVFHGNKGAYRVIGGFAANDLSRYHLGVGEPVGIDRLVVLCELETGAAGDALRTKAVVDDFRIAARLSHPNVLSPVDAGKTPTSYFLAVPLPQGDGLGRLVQAASEAGQRLSPALAAFLVSQAADGLAHAGRIAAEVAPGHRILPNLYPGHLLVDSTGRTRLSAFGTLPGTAGERGAEPVAYASPEQCEGKEPDARSDVFSLGVILWELLAQRPLFRRVSQQATLQSILTCAVPSLSGIDCDVPRELEAIALHALQRQPTARFEGVDALAEALREHLADKGASELSFAAFVQSVLIEHLRKKRSRLQALLNGEGVDLGLLLPDTQHTLAWPVRAIPGDEQTGTSSLPPKPPKSSPPTPTPPKSSRPTPTPPKSSPPTPTPTPERHALSQQGRSGAGQHASQPALHRSAVPFRDRLRTRPALAVFLGLLAALAGAALGLIVWPLFGDSARTALIERAPEPPPQALLAVGSAPGGCPVWLDAAELQGRTPLGDRALTPDVQHVVEVRCDGYEAEVVQFTPLPGERVILALNPEPIVELAGEVGSLELHSRPGVSVFLGDRKLGQTPLATQLPSGEHTLRLVDERGSSAEIHVRIAAGKTTRLFKQPSAGFDRSPNHLRESSRPATILGGSSSDKPLTGAGGGSRR